MGITHAKVSAIADGADTSLVRPSDWNAGHVIALADGDIPASIARDSEVTAEIATHAAAGDPHTVYRLESADHSHASTGLQAGTVDHGVLTGMADDDHTQYVLRSILTTRGDLFRRGAAAIERVGLGAQGQAVRSDGTDAVWAQPVPAITPKSTGRYISQAALGTTGAAPTLDRLTLMAVNLPSGTIDRLGVWITGGGAAGSVVRLGLYLPDADGMPDALLVDGGTVDTTGTGFKEVTVSQAVPAGLIFLAACPQTAAPTWVHTNRPETNYISETTPTNALLYSYFQASVSGAFPANTSGLSVNTGAGNNARFWVRYSA